MTRTLLAALLLLSIGSAAAIDCFVCHPRDSISQCNEQPFNRSSGCSLCSRLRVVLKDDKRYMYKEKYPPGTAYRYPSDAKGLMVLRTCISDLGLKETPTMQYLVGTYPDVCARDRNLFMNFIDETYGFMSHVFWRGDDKEMARAAYETAQKLKEQLSKLPKDVEFEVCTCLTRDYCND